MGDVWLFTEKAVNVLFSLERPCFANFRSLFIFGKFLT